jgi:ABC-type antimicrobial peptide transport system permease subunit
MRLHCEHAVWILDCSLGGYVLGGIIGIIVGVGTSALISYFAKWSILVSPTAIAMAFVFSWLAGTSSVTILRARIFSTPSKC